MTACPVLGDNDMSPEEARAITDRIKANLDDIWELMVDAFVRRAWRALGYQSWDAYRIAEFGQCRIKLPQENQREVIRSLREHGLSLRQIESVSGLSRPTVIKNLRQEPDGVVNSLPPRHKPKPKRDMFVETFNGHLIALQKAAFGLQDGMRAPEFGEHLAQLYRQTLENVVFALELLDKAYAQPARPARGRSTMTRRCAARKTAYTPPSVWLPAPRAVGAPSTPGSTAIGHPRPTP